MPDLKITLRANNIGIHTSHSTEIATTAAKLGIYASNGSGKTFLSKAFALYQKANTDPTGIEAREVKRLLAFGSETGTFEFSIEGINPPIPPETLHLKLSDSSIATIDAASKYRFHVFNSDYVKRNLEERSFLPNGEIPGVILGGANIDLTDLEEQLSDRIQKIEQIRANVANCIEAAKGDLATFGIRSNLTEYRELSEDNLLRVDYSPSEIESFDVLVGKYEKLKALPDDLDDVRGLTEYRDEISSDELLELLGSSHTLSSFAESFKAKFSQRKNFIESGLNFLDGDECPFCEQQLLPDAFSLIDLYRAYIEDEESQITEKAHNLRRALSKKKKAIDQLKLEHGSVVGSFNSVRSFLPKSEDVTLSSFPDSTEPFEAIDNLDALLKEKMENITFSVDSSEARLLIDSIIDHEKQINLSIIEDQSAIRELNRRKNDSGGQKRSLRKELCIAKVKALRDELSLDRTDFHAARQEEIALREEIRVKQSQNKREKKAEVTVALKELLAQFFGSKYSLDEEKFCLTLSDERLASNADDVLSDGEKGIVAFCHYLAMTHAIVDSDDDYKNLIFVIDDPVSSMDFHYVYKVAESIRRLNVLFPLADGRIRFLIFTHNLEFISILDRNGICNHSFGLRDGTLTKIEPCSALPYEPHLKDIIKIADGIEEPNHTTPNSIRHTLETIGKFLRPGTSFEAFFREVEELKSDPFLWSLTNDQSHGAFRDQPSFIPDDIRRSCLLVVNFITTQFPHQVESLR